MPWATASEGGAGLAPRHPGREPSPSSPTTRGSKIHPVRKTLSCGVMYDRELTVHERKPGFLIRLLDVRYLFSLKADLRTALKGLMNVNTVDSSCVEVCLWGTRMPLA